MILFDYEVLRLIWWVLLGVLLIGFTITDGFDMGVGILSPLLGKTDDERRVAINTVGPIWEGNQVWIILGGGAIFAAWPAVYALSFSGFYLAIFLVLFGFILRPVAFKYRSKLDQPRWRQTWDWLLFTGSFLPALLFGVAVGNVIQGVPFHLTENLTPVYEGNLFGLLNPFALGCGLLSLTMITAHGAAWLSIKADKVVAERADAIFPWLMGAVAVLFALLSAAVLFGWAGGYTVTSDIVWDGPSNPTYKDVVADSGAWVKNFTNQPWLMIIPILAVGAPLLSIVFAKVSGPLGRFALSKTTIFAVIATVGLGMFPFILPSSVEPGHSLMVFDASSSQNTLRNMLIATVLFLPIILAYTAWVYKILWGRVTLESVNDPSQHSY